MAWRHGPTLTLLLLCAACASTPDADRWLARVGSNAPVLQRTDLEEADRLERVAANLVSVLAQLPETSPSRTTVQVSRATTAFGNAVLHAMESAGYGMQLVSADQGRHYLSYSRRRAETDAGPVVDYVIAIGTVQVRREFVMQGEALLPSSLVDVIGSRVERELVLDDRPFRDAGGIDSVFVSGVRTVDGSSGTAIRELRTRPGGKAGGSPAIDTDTLLASARERGVMLVSRTQAEASDAGLDLLRRTVLILDPARPRVLGAGNKRALGSLVRTRRSTDRFLVTSCTGSGRRDAAARARGLRVVEELLVLGVPGSHIELRPCRRTAYRTLDGDAPAPVEVVQGRPR